MSLPGLEVLGVPHPCDYCGEPVYLTDPVYCAPCAERLALEKIREDSNEYRRQAQIRLDLAQVRQRVKRYLRGEP